MDIAAIILLVCGAVILLGVVWRERAGDIGIACALDRLERPTGSSARTLLIVSGVLGAVGAGLVARVAGSVAAVSAAGSIAIVPWLVWLWFQDTYRALVDATVLGQDLVDPERRPLVAFRPPAVQALSFRPFALAVASFVALGGGLALFVVIGPAFGDGSAGVRSAAWGYAAAVTFYIAYRVRRGIDAEMDVRAIASKVANASTEDLLRALRENPRSRPLLQVHAARLAAGGDVMQARVESRAVALRRSAAGGASDAASEPYPEPSWPTLRLRAFASRPTVQVAPLELPPDAWLLGVLDPAEAAAVLLSLPAEETPPNLLVSLKPTPASLPDVARADGPWAFAGTAVFARAYRLTPEVRTAVQAAIDGDVRTVRALRIFTPRRLLCATDDGFATIRLDPEDAEQVYAELRRAGAIAVRREEP